MAPARRWDVGDGRKLTIDEMATEAGKTREAIEQRIRAGKTGAALIDRANGGAARLYDTGDGRKMTIDQICDETGLARETIRWRVANRITGQRLFANNIKVRVVEVDGEQLDIRTIAARAGVSTSTINGRIASGVTGRALFAGPHGRAAHVDETESCPPPRQEPPAGTPMSIESGGKYVVRCTKNPRCGALIWMGQESAHKCDVRTAADIVSERRAPMEVW